MDRADGWLLLAGLAMAKRDAPDDACSSRGPTAPEREIHGATNRVRDATSSAPVAIAMRSDAVEETAIAGAERIRAVDVDPGETGCGTPAAGPYVRWDAERRRAKEPRAAAKKGAKRG